MYWSYRELQMLSKYNYLEDEDSYGERKTSAKLMPSHYMTLGKHRYISSAAEK